MLLSNHNSSENKFPSRSFEESPDGACGVHFVLVSRVGWYGSELYDGETDTGRDKVVFYFTKQTALI